MVMKRNAMRRNLRNSIVRSLGRYIAIAAIIALGSGIFVGLLMTKSDMVATGQAFMDAQNMFDRACAMDPYNQEYRVARDQLRAQTAGYGYGYHTASRSDDTCNCCSQLICADCCCEMMGGDLIRCC